MLRWALLDEHEYKGVVEGSLTVYASGREALLSAEHDWNHTDEEDRKRASSYYVGLFNVDENENFYEDEDGNVDSDCRVVLKDWLIDTPEESRIKRILRTSGENGKVFSDKYGIPYKSLRHWIDGDRQAPDYVLDMLEQIVWMDKENR